MASCHVYSWLQQKWSAVFTYPSQKSEDPPSFLSARPHHGDMHAFISAPILALVWLSPLAASAQAHPAFLHALSDQELAINAAGESITISFDADDTKGRAEIAGKTLLSQNILSIRAFGDDTGTASVTQAATSLSLRATLRSAGGVLRNVDP
jgi:hypothetical protein